MEVNNTLDSLKVEQTIEKLSARINERFPGSGLGNTCENFLQFTKNSKASIDWIAKPNLLLRSVAYISIALVLGLIVYSLTLVDFKLKSTLSEIVTVLEASINNIVFLGAGIFFLYTLENRWKRIRTIKFLNQVRGFAHVVDMHQLTKDPQLLASGSKNTKSSPKRLLNKYEMQRYLDYCDEFLSLIGKVAALYSQSIPDEVILQSANEIESLCSNMANKVWQKMNILSQIDETKIPS